MDSMYVTRTQALIGASLISRYRPHSCISMCVALCMYILFEMYVLRNDSHIDTGRQPLPH